MSVSGGPPWFVPHLRCPDCGGELGADPTKALTCERCARRFSVSGRQIDCVVSAGIARECRFPTRQVEAGRPAPSDPPDRAYVGPITPRTSRRHLGVMASRPGTLDVLDWGCGTAEYRPLVEALGHRYVGVDGAGSGADVLVDVHSLPFASETFDHVITNAVLEHVANPFLAMREVARVLRHDGILSGSVAFLEPYHYRSHFHVTADGVMHVLGDAGLRVEALWPQEAWLVFDSLATMPGPLSWPSRQLLRLAGALEGLIRLRHLHPRAIATGRWLRRKAPGEYREELLTIAGQVDFVARKP